MLLIFSDKITSRLQYTFKVIFSEVLGIEFELTKNRDEFKSFEGPKFSYGNQAPEESLHFISDDLLFSKGINISEPEIIEFSGVKALFPVLQQNRTIPYDPFAATFFMLSRYEEYMPYKRDQFGRFDCKDSIAYKQGFLRKPVVNIWIRQIAEILRKNYPGIEFHQKKYNFIPSYDIDIAYAYRLKGVTRTLLGYIKALLKADINEIRERTAVLMGQMQDPYDTYDYQLSLQKTCNLKPIYFILFGNYGPLDKNLPVNHTGFHALIKHIADYAEVGIHPSFTSHENFSLLEQEVHNLSNVLNTEIKKSRQHYLKIALPHAYRNLLKLDIADDYSMGYPSEPGFRAGICHSYNFYDIDYEAETRLRIHPLAIMDGTLKDYMKLSPDEAIHEIKQIIDEIKAVDGTFISLWHNESLSGKKRWIDWRRVYEALIRMAVEE